MSNKHRHILESIFRDPIGNNLHWREVESLLHHLGAEVETGHGAIFHVRLKRHEFTIHHPHHGSALGRMDIKHLREHLAAAGATLSGYDEQNRRDDEGK
jgi:hypothetical protein